MNARMMAVGGLGAILLAAAGMAQADVFNMGPGLTSLETVTVGNPGNAADTRYDPYGFGRVDYEYNIGKYEVTAGQYTEFLNKVGKTDTYGVYNTAMWGDYGSKIQRSGSPGSYTYSVAADWANRPVNYVSWGDAARFANWLHNGQPTGTQNLSTTEDGAYYLNGATSISALMAVNRETDWKWAVTSEDEWYKAAYHKNDGVTGNYFEFPTSSDRVPSNDLLSPDGGNNANFCALWPDANGYTIGSPYWRTPVGEFELSESPYGTFDQGGNVYEWNEGVSFPWSRAIRGGSFGNGYADQHAAHDWGYDPTCLVVGFRVSEFPEPSTHVLCVGVTWINLHQCVYRGDLDADNICATLRNSLPTWDTRNKNAGMNFLEYGDGTNLSEFREGFEELAARVIPNDTFILFLATHGDTDGNGSECLFLASDPTGCLTDNELAGLLADPRLSKVKKIVIIGSCYSGGFGPEIIGRASNVAVLAACSESNTTPFDPQDGRGVFAKVLCSGLTRSQGGFFGADLNFDGKVTLDELSQFVHAYDYGDLMGKELPLLVPGETGVFTGLDLVFACSEDFDGIIVPEPVTLSLLGVGGVGVLGRSSGQVIRRRGK